MLIDQYQETQVMTASPVQLHLLVVDGALQHARQALLNLESGNREAAHFSLNRSREFVGELLFGIRADFVPALGENLKQLFTFVFHRLVSADLEQNAARAQDAIRILQQHRDTWVELMSQIGVPPDQNSDNPGESEYRATEDIDGRRSWSA
ncbi:MAG: flagellar export chaperone FliS [Planctomycetaceae bacterium]